MKTVIFCLVLAVAICQGGESVDTAFQAGLEALRAENNVAAIKAFTRAADLAEAAHDDAKAVEINSMIYFTHKKFTLAQSEALHKTDEKAAVKAEAVIAKKVEPTDADKWMDRAQKFVSAHKDDPLRCAATMFEVADRFSETATGRSAMKESLAWIAKVKSEVKVVTQPIKVDPKAQVSSDAVAGVYEFINYRTGAPDPGGFKLKLLPGGKFDFARPGTNHPGNKWNLDGQSLVILWAKASAIDRYHFDPKLEAFVMDDDSRTVGLKKLK